MSKTKTNKRQNKRRSRKRFSRKNKTQRGGATFEDRKFGSICGPQYVDLKKAQDFYLEHSSKINF